MNMVIPKTIHKNSVHPDSVRMRGHHLLCMLGWKGVGYTPAFTINYNKIIERLKTETVTIEIIEGKDDICAPLNSENYEGYHCEDEDVLIRDKKALDDINRTLGLNLTIGSQFEISEIYLADMRALFQKYEIRSACAGCSWHDFCSDIAADNFKDTKL